MNDRCEKSVAVDQDLITLDGRIGASSLTGLRTKRKGEFVAIPPGQACIRTDWLIFRGKIADPSAEWNVTVSSASGARWPRVGKGTTNLPLSIHTIPHLPSR